MASKPTALEVMRVALQQYGVTEKPAGSNNVKYNTAFYGHAVRGGDYAWCAVLVWWSGWIASGKDQKLNPFVKSANAATIQDSTVKNKDGKYVLVHTSNNTKKKAALPKIKFGDEISFNFNGGTSRLHTALVVGRWGNYIWCIEGNTSFDERGSQSNGGCVALRQRYYTTDVCTIRPDYKAGKFHEPTEPYHGKAVSLPARGWFEYGDKNSKVNALQEALTWANGYKLQKDGELFGKTFAEIVIFQVAQGLEPDGQFGEDCLKKLNALIKKHEPNTNVTTETEKPAEEKPSKKKSKREQWCDYCKKCAWPLGTKKKVYSYPKGKRRKEYVKALAKAFKNRSGWRRQTRLGASCDVAVAAIIRALGIDKKFPRGCDDIVKYLKSKRGKKYWKCIKEKNWKKWKPFTVVFQIYKTGGKHICIYLGNGLVFNAHYKKKTYPRIEKASKIIKSPSKCKTFKVFVPRNI